MREEAHISQSQFSQLLNMPQYRLSSLELGKCIPTDAEIAKITLVIEKLTQGEIKPRVKKEFQKKFLITLLFLLILDVDIQKQIEMKST